MYFYEASVLLSRSYREFSRRLGKKWRIFKKNSRIFIKKLKDLDKKLKEFCPKLSNLATLSWWWLLKIGQKKSLLRHNCCGKHFLQKKFDSPVINLSTLDLIRSPSWSCWCCTETTRMMTQSLITWPACLSFFFLVLICCDLFLQCFAF